MIRTSITSTYNTSTSITSTYITSIYVTSIYIISNYSTSTYNTSTSITSTYITSTSITSTFITSTSITSTSITSTSITSTYITSIYITSTYITSTSITSTFITSTSITSTYITSIYITSTYITSTSITSTFNTSIYITSIYITRSSITSTYITITYITSIYITSTFNIAIDIYTPTTLFAVRGQKRDYVFEFEDTLNKTEDNWQYRSNASGNKTLRINDELGNKSITFTLYIKPQDNDQQVILLIKNIDYSNDGPSDDVNVRFNNYLLGSFKTRANWDNGYGWNMIQNSGDVGWRFAVMNGKCNITISAKTDQWGVELDRIVFETEYQDPEQDLIYSTKFDG